MKNPKNSRGLAIRRALLWEAAYLPIELVAVGLGLYLALIANWLTAGTLWLIFVCAGTFAIRLAHYQKVAPTIHGT